MASTRRYKLLCPISRALDRIGDRWTLLILRDLHAGPARFSELQVGLTGIAANLLTDRLQQLTSDGLVEKQLVDHGVTLYALTDLGKRTREVLFELAMFGGRFAPDEEVRRPGNLRTIAVTLSSACQRVVSRYANVTAEIIVDDEAFTLTVADGAVEMIYAPAASPDVTMRTSYEPMIAAAEGELPMSDYLERHVDLTVHTPRKDVELMKLLGDAMQVFGNDA